MTLERPDPEEFSPRDAVERFLDRRRSENTANTIRSYRNRLDRFVEWADEIGLESMDQLDGWLLDEYRAHRESTGVAPATVRGQMVALSQLLQFCVAIDIVDEELPEKIQIPHLSDDDATSDEKLEEDAARLLLGFYRDSARHFGTAPHALLELLWHVGPRMSCVLALDLRDWDPDERVLRFRHRPPTRLKDGSDHERNVLVSPDVADALEYYIARERPEDVRDDRGREPLFATSEGRPSRSTIRGWSYRSTQPCVAVECPHGRRRPSCEWTHRDHLSKCPSSRAPHAIRTGSITWQLNQGLDYVRVAKRVAASPETIRRYYDKPDFDDELERRREITAEMDIEDPSEDQ